MKFCKVLLLIICFCCSGVEASAWESVNVMRAIDCENLLLSDGRVVQIAGYDGPDLHFPTMQERDSARRTFQLIKHLLVNQRAKIMPADPKCKENVCGSHVKLEDGKYLTEKLLELGLGKLIRGNMSERFQKKYSVAQEFAVKNMLGQWGKSAQQESSEIVRDIAGVNTMKWKKKFGHYLAPISSGRVKKVVSGNTFFLESGLCVKLLGVESPSPDDSRKGHSCFGAKAKQNLERLIMGKKVELRRDISQLDESRCLIRHVWIPGKLDQLNSDIHVNWEMISQGYGRAAIPGKNKLYRKEFNSIQEEIYLDPRGAWLSCAREILGGKENVNKSPPMDAECPIKISSSGKYHTPKSSWYGRLNAVKCFMSARDAEEAGYPKAN